MAKKTISRAVKKRARDYLGALQAAGLPITKTYIFGSSVRGTRRPSSDIDICVISPAFKRMRDPLAFLWTQRKDRHLGIEPVGYTPREFRDGTDPLAVEVKKTGVSISV